MRRDCVVHDCRLKGPLSISASCPSLPETTHTMQYNRTGTHRCSRDSRWQIELWTHGSSRSLVGNHNSSLEHFACVLSFFFFFNLVCFYYPAKWHKTHSTGWLQICACTVMHKCNLFKLALHVEPPDCWVQALQTTSCEHVVIMTYHGWDSYMEKKKIKCYQKVCTTNDFF